MSQAYYRKWRPQGWEEVIGQDHVTRTLRNALVHGNLVHAYLFSGPRGTGKTTTARIIAKAVNCLAEDQSQRPCNQCAHCQEINQGRFLDLIEIDAASNTSVEDVRDLREKINYSPSRGRYKVYIIDEVHMLSNAAFNALLKTLEEPPAHAIFILATTEMHKIPATVLSRCQRHEFRRIPLNFIQALLKEIAEKEGVKIEASAITAIARQATGSMRDAVSMLDQLASTGADITLEFTQQVLGTAAAQSVYDLLEAVLAEDSGLSIGVINRALDAGSDPRQYARQIVDVLRAVVMVRMGNSDQLEITDAELEKIKILAERFSLDKLLKALQSFDRAAQQPSLSWQPGLQLELAATRLASGEWDAESSPGMDVDKKAKKNNTVSRHGQKSTIPAKPIPETKMPISIPVQPKADSPDEKKATSDLEAASIESKAATEGIDSDTDVDSSKAQAGKPGGNELERINESWKEIRAAAKELSAETGALLNSCRTVNTRKGRLVLGFASELLRSKMENGHNQENARQAISKIAGVDIQIDCRVAGKQEAQVPDEIDRDGLVGTALSLGGKLTKTE